MENLDLLGKKYTSNEVYEIFGSFSALEKVIFPQKMTYYNIDGIYHIVDVRCDLGEVAKIVAFGKATVQYLKEDFSFDEDWGQWYTLGAQSTSREICLDKTATEELRHFPAVLVDEKYLVRGLSEIKQVLALAS